MTKGITVNNKVIRIIFGSLPLGLISGITVVLYSHPGFALSKTGTSIINPLIALLIYAATTILVTACGCFLKKRNHPVKEYAVAGFGVCAWFILQKISFHSGLFLFFSGSIIIYAYFLLRKGCVLEDFEFSKKTSLIILTSLFLIYSFLTGGAAIMKYQCWLTGTFDSGIFTQIFYAMSTNLSQVVTVEFNKVISHFSVHVSPFLYLLLPGYLIGKSTVALIIMQTLFMGSSIFPLYLIARKRGLSNFQATLLPFCLILSPIMTNSVMFSFHAVEFSMPIVLWLLYFYEKKYIKATLIMSALLLMIREDMPIPCFFISIYAWLALREKRALIPAVMSILWYIICVKVIIPQSGGVPCFDRYSALMAYGTGSAAFGKTIIGNPLYALHTVLTTDKTLFVMQIMLPLLFLPLFRLRGLILLIPAVLMHLLSNYEPLYQVYYHYPTTTLAICLYLATTNAGFFKRRKICSTALALCVILSALCGVAFTSRFLVYYPLYLKHQNNFKEFEIIGKSIPEDQGVSTSLRFGPKLANRKNLRIFPNTTDCNYIFLDLRPGFSHSKDLKKFMSDIAQKNRNGFGITKYRRGAYLLMEKGRGAPMNRNLALDIIKVYTTQANREKRPIKAK